MEEWILAVTLNGLPLGVRALEWREWIVALSVRTLADATSAEYRDATEGGVAAGCKKPLDI
jgi:hypothetical protein